MKALTHEAIDSDPYLDGMEATAGIQLSRPSIVGEYDDLGTEIARMTIRNASILTFTSDPSRKVKGQVSMGGYYLFDSRIANRRTNITEAPAFTGLRDLLHHVVDDVPTLSQPIAVTAGFVYTEPLRRSLGRGRPLKTFGSMVRAGIIDDGVQELNRERLAVMDVLGIAEIDYPEVTASMPLARVTGSENHSSIARDIAQFSLGHLPGGGFRINLGQAEYTTWPV